MQHQRKILVNVIANKKIGLGHVYNILTILPHFKNDIILIVMNEKNCLGKINLKKNHIKLKLLKIKINSLK